jgi:hypothetical protein
LLQQADLALNLRYPTMGEASGSQLRIWANGVPSAVTDVGWYSQLPSDAVIKIRPPDREHADILALLRKLARGKIDLDAMGRAAAQSIKSHAPKSYLRNVLDWMEKSLSHAPLQWMMRRHLDRIAQEHAAITTVDFTPCLPASFQFQSNERSWPLHRRFRARGSSLLPDVELTSIGLSC